MTYVCTEKTTINEWLKEIEELKKELEFWQWKRETPKDRRIEILIKENKELRKQNREQRTELSQAEEDYRKLENELAEQMDGWNGLRDEIEYWKRKYKELKEKLDTLELCIKNKDELLEEYRKKIDKLRTDNIYEEWLYG